MVLADIERVQPHLIGEDRLLDEFPDHVRMRLRITVGANPDIAERVEPEQDWRLPGRNGG
ncbi:hypothetical protein GCM10027449_25470 [Sinomonas notoginsengisoli]